MKGNRQLIILGASVRAAAFSAVRAGYAPYAVDLFADRDLEAICPAVKISRYPREFLAALAAAPDAPWMYCGGLENHPGSIDQLAAMRPLLGNGGNVVRRVRDPKRLRDVVHAAGLPFPEISRRPAEIGQWLLKPRRSSGGIGIRFPLANDLDRAPRGAYFQRFVEGQSVSAAFVGSGGRAVLIGITRQLLGRDFGHIRPFLYLGSIGPLAFNDAERSSLTDLGNVLAKQFALSGLFNVDLVQSDEGLWPVEVNPRYSASLEILERVHGTRVIDLHVAACESFRLPETAFATANRCAGKSVVYALRDATVPDTFDALVREWNVASEWPGIADLPRVGEQVHAGQPVVTVLAEGESLDQVEAELRRRIAAVERLLTV